MSFSRKTLCLAGVAAVCLSTLPARAATPPAGEQDSLKQAPMPHQRQSLPPSAEQSRYNLPPSSRPRNDLLPRHQRNSVAAPLADDCGDMNKLAGYSGAALADYLVSLPNYECTYGLFAAAPELAARIYSGANFGAVAARFAQEAASYSAANMALVNLTLYLRAGYYQAEGGAIPAPAATLTRTLRAPLRQLTDGSALFRPNSAATSTAGEVLKLITNMHDEAYFLPSMKALVQRYTNTAARPKAADGLREATAANGYTGVLTVLFYAHGRPDGQALLRGDLSYPTALYNFVSGNKADLLGSAIGYQLNDTANEAFRFMQYADLKAGVQPMVQATLASSSMTGPDGDLWLAAASAVKFYDNDHCAQYGTCDYTTQLADAVLKYRKDCSPTLHIRAQDMTDEQMQQSCDLLAREESYAHAMLQTKRVPVANDHNTSLELVVFDDYTNYSKYAGLIYGISTNNGGMYLEGDPSNPANQARFIAHEASWLRPVFQVWNLEHEYVHYLDGRFDMAGDFGAATAKPTVWWIEGIAEYLSLKNNNQVAIDMARGGNYRLSTIFGNTYAMNDYVNRAYRWGYMATRFMVERHRSVIDTMLGQFRVGDYDSYQQMMAGIGATYDDEFASWAATASTAGEPPMPQPALPVCASPVYLGRNCALVNLAASSQAYAYINLPAGATNVRLSTGGGGGDVDLYVALDRYPTPTSYDMASAGAGNAESVTLASPVSGHWYYILLRARQPFSGVSLSATYD
ncbi:collagenase [Duganella sp. FT3S]|uniref:microbial collagenase n=1 Tax=Rugamonas fusca TaxID=2758568 RepID=A0A7W2I6N1_9BURK|nr:M9 family metallopeptidase [Rugamonas fusca]MBA5605646.1 collagenase [Rugamonas fusca]